MRHRASLFVTTVLILAFYAGVNWLAFSSRHIPTASEDLADAAQVMRLKAKTYENADRRVWLEYLPKKNQYIHDHIRKLKGKTIHVVLQTHDDPIEPMTPEGIVAVEISQAKVYHALEQIRPKLLAIEGVFSDEPTESDLANMALFWVRYSSVVYAHRHPECITVAAEPDVIGRQDLEYLRHKHYEVFWASVRFRSYYALARVADKMQKHKMSGGAAIVIGAGHRTEFERAAKEFKIKIIFHDAS